MITMHDAEGNSIQADKDQVQQLVEAGYLVGEAPKKAKGKAKTAKTANTKAAEAAKKAE